MTVCPVCEGRLRKVLNAVGVVFKGSGFYRNDSRAAANGSSGTTAGAPDKAGADKSSSTSDGASTKESGSKDTGSKDYRRFHGLRVEGRRVERLRLERLRLERLRLERLGVEGLGLEGVQDRGRRSRAGPRARPAGSSPPPRADGRPAAVFHRSAAASMPCGLGGLPVRRGS